MLTMIGSNGRLLSNPAATVQPRETLERLAVRPRAQWERLSKSSRVKQLISRLQRRQAAEDVEQPAFAGTWQTARTEGFDSFLKEMGVGSLKRSIAGRATQQQYLKLEGKFISLEITDRRGKMSYQIYPDDKVHSGKGFMKLPIKQRAKWGRDGALLVEELYSQHLGGDDDGQPCSGDACPLVRSRRSVDKSGQMVVELERKLNSGEVVKMRTWYKPTGKSQT